METLSLVTIGNVILTFHETDGHSCSFLCVCVYRNNSALCVTLQSAVLLGTLVLQQTYSLINHMEMWKKKTFR